MNKCCIYKKRDNIELNQPMFEYTSPYVYVEDFLINPFEEDIKVKIMFNYIDIETLERLNILETLYCSVEEFEQHFELYMNEREVFHKVRSLDSNNSNY